MTSNLYRVWCKFEPNHVNHPAGRRGQWRVTSCYPDHYSDDKTEILKGYMGLRIASTKPYPRGSIIRPHKELRRVLEARKQP